MIVETSSNPQFLSNTYLVADGEGRKDEATHRMSGRARDNRLSKASTLTPMTAAASMLLNS